MKNPKVSVRQRLAGKPLIGFDSRGEVPRSPRAMVGFVAEIKPAT
jgi:hypothetical protein